MSLDTSVIICNYNNAQYLGRAIRSCLKQSMDASRFEVIVVDDKSTDKSKNVVRSFGDKIVSIYLKENVGVAEASNEGIRSALGRFIIRVDADDYINENTLLFMTEVLNSNPDIGFVYGDHLKVDSDGKLIERFDLTTIDKVKRHGAGIMFRKSYLETIGLYDKTFRNAEDYELLTRYFKNFDGYHLRLPLYRYTQHGKNMTRNDGARKIWERRSKKKHDKNRK